MKSKAFFVMGVVAFVLAGIQFAWTVIAVVLSLFEGGGAAALPADTMITYRCDPLVDGVIRLAPFALLVFLFGLGYYFRWLAQRFEA